MEATPTLGPVTEPWNTCLFHVYFTWSVSVSLGRKSCSERSPGRLQPGPSGQARRARPALRAAAAAGGPGGNGHFPEKPRRRGRGGQREFPARSPALQRGRTFSRESRRPRRSGGGRSPARRHRRPPAPVTPLAAALPHLPAATAAAAPPRQWRPRPGRARCRPR